MSEEFAILVNTLGAILVVLYFAGVLYLAFEGVRRIPYGLGSVTYTWSHRFFGAVMFIGAATAVDAAVGRHEWLTLLAVAAVVAVLGVVVNNHEHNIEAKKRLAEMEELRRRDEEPDRLRFLG